MGLGVYPYIWYFYMYKLNLFMKKTSIPILKDADQ